MRTVTTVACQLLVFAAVGLLITWPSLNYPWYGDDLHLIRVFSNEELRSVWTGNWDVDGLESGGYRPLTVVFNHARASVLGEAVAAHRLFTIMLCAVYLVLIGLIGRRFALTPAAMLLAGVMMVCAKYSWYHLVWISDGVHLAQGIAFALAALAILRWIESGAVGWWCASLLLFVLSVLVREDSLAIAPVLVGMVALHASTERQLTARLRGVTAYAVAIIVVSVSALWARQAVMTASPAPAWTGPLELVAHLVAVVTLAGWQPMMLVPLFVLVFAVLAATALRSEFASMRMAWFWLSCAGVSTAPAIVESRVNLLFFPITFYCLFVAEIVTRCASGQVQVFPRWNRVFAVLVAFCCVALPAYQSRRQQLSIAPGSTGRLETDCDFARSAALVALTATKRRQANLAELWRLDVSSTACDALLDASGEIRSDVRLPEGLFVPPQSFLSR